MTDKIQIDRSVVEQALEALDEADLLMEHRQNIELRRSARRALRAALEQPQVEQEPVAWYDGKKFYGSQAAASMNMANMAALAPLYAHPQPPRQPLTCNSCKGLGRVYRGCNEWAACVHCNTTGIGGEK